MKASLHIVSLMPSTFRKGVEDNQRIRRRRHGAHRERLESTSSSSIYFTASQGIASPYEENSEGGYVPARRRGVLRWGLQYRGVVPLNMPSGAFNDTFADRS